MEVPIDSTALLEVDSLCYAYNGRSAVDHVSFAIRRGEVFGLLGPNGAGKTTTISCIAGLRVPRSGAMRFAGAPFAPARNGADRARLGIVPQELAVYGHLTARENLRFFGALGGFEPEHLEGEVARLLDLAGLAERAGQQVRHFSGGMKRRLNLVLGCLGSPPLVILDEPTVGVDPQSRNHIFGALERLPAAGSTLLFTTHYMEEAERLCGRIAIMDQGRIIAVGSKDELAAGAGIPGENLEKVFLALTGRRLRDS